MRQVACFTKLSRHWRYKHSENHPWNHRESLRQSKGSYNPNAQVFCEWRAHQTFPRNHWNHWQKRASKSSGLAKSVETLEGASQRFSVIPICVFVLDAILRLVFRHPFRRGWICGLTPYHFELHHKIGSRPQNCKSQSRCPLKLCLQYNCAGRFDTWYIQALFCQGFQFIFWAIGFSF